jgi:hypothetical protein
LPVVWQPGKTQWRLMWALAIVLLLAWPAGDGSLGVKTIRWLADPRGMLPQLPPPLSMELDDNADAVAEHDAAEQEYYSVAASSGWARTRLRLKELTDPLDVTTERQILVGIGVLGALLVWRVSR